MKAINIAELTDGKIAIIVPGLSVTVDEINPSVYGLILKNEGVFVGTIDPRAKVRYLYGSEGF